MTKYLGVVELETVEGVETVEDLIAADSGVRGRVLQGDELARGAIVVIDKGHDDGAALRNGNHVAAGALGTCPCQVPADPSAA